MTERKPAALRHLVRDYLADAGEPDTRSAVRHYLAASSADEIAQTAQELRTLLDAQLDDVSLRHVVEEDLGLVLSSSDEPASFLQGVLDILRRWLDGKRSEFVDEYVRDLESPATSLGHKIQAVNALSVLRVPLTGRATRALLASLKSPDVQVRDAASAVLAILRERSAIPELERMVSDDDRNVRCTAAAALLALTDGRHAQATGLLACALRANDDAVRFSAVYALQRVGAPAGAFRRELAASLYDGDWLVRAMSARILGGLSMVENDIVRHLEHLTNDANVEVRKAAAEAIRAQKVGSSGRQ